MERFVDSAVYSDAVVARFDAPPNAAAPVGANRLGTAESAARGAKVRLHLRITEDRVEAAGFEALGCPHTIAAASRVAEDLPGRRLDELAAYTAGWLDRELPLPAEKLDIRILLEDAVRDAAAGGN